MKEIILKQNHFNVACLDSFLVQYLHSLGINKIESFINKPSEDDEDDPCNLENMDKAVKTAHQMFEQGCNVFVMVDSDTDGYTSSAILINYINRRYPQVKVNWALHPGKEHGIDLAAVPADTNLVFIPDAGSNQFTEQRTLCDSGKTVIVLDHHEVEDMEQYRASPAIIVNNQVSKAYGNYSLSGAGVVYKFIKLFDRYYFHEAPIYHDYGDLAAIGIIADVMNMTTLDNNYIAYWGLSHIHNKFIQMLAAKQSRGIKNPDRLTKTDVGFYIAPVINGVIRSGAPEDKQAVFEALITNEDDTFYDHTWRGVTTQETRWERAVRLATNAKSRQDAQKRKSFEWLCEKVRNEKLDQHNLIIVMLSPQESNKVSANIGGLVAMELVQEFNKPVLVVRQTELNGVSVYGGSGRNGNFKGLPSLKRMLEDAGIHYAAGHGNAMGVFLTPEQIPSIIEYFDSHLNKDDFEMCYEVDYWYHTGEYLDQTTLLTIAEHDYLWGNGIPQPRFAFDFNFMRSDFNLMGKDHSSLKMRFQGIDFVSFKDRELIDQLTRAGSGHITLVGRPQLNEWNGRKSIQIIIEDANVFTADAKTVSINDLI